MPNGLGQTALSVKGVEPISSDWSLVFKFENGFDPFTLRRANGPKSLVENNTTPLDAQTANGDSSRAGQLFNTEAYAGFSRPMFGTLTAGRQNSLILRGLGDYDAMGAAPAFSVIGVSNIAGGGRSRRSTNWSVSAICPTQKPQSGAGRKTSASCASMSCPASGRLPSTRSAAGTWRD